MSDALWTPGPWVVDEQEFITNGIEYGCIRMPEAGDCAHDTLPKIRVAHEVRLRAGARRFANARRAVHLHQPRRRLSVLGVSGSVLARDVGSGRRVMRLEIRRHNRQIREAAR